MSTVLWNPITAARMASGKLFTPELGLDFMGNDWSLLSTAFDWGCDQDGGANSDTAWHDAKTVRFYHSDAFSVDAAFDDLEVAIGVRLQIKTSDALVGFAFRLKNGANVSVDAGTTSTSYVASNYMVLSLPSVATYYDVIIQFAADDTTPVAAGNFKRDFGTLGCDSYFLVRQTP